MVVVSRSNNVEVSRSTVVYVTMVTDVDNGVFPDLVVLSSPVVWTLRVVAEFVPCGVLSCSSVVDMVKVLLVGFVGGFWCLVFGVCVADYKYTSKMK